MHRVPVLLVLSLSACGGATAAVRTLAGEPPMPTSSRSDEMATSTTLAPVALPVSPPGLATTPPSGDLGSCPLAVVGLELGDPGDEPPSAPAAVPGGFVVAFTRYDAAGASHLYLQRASEAGALEPALLLRANVHATRPVVLSHADDVEVVTYDPAVGALALRLDPRTLAVVEERVLTAFPDDAALGPRGLVWTEVDGEHRRVHREAGETAFPGPSSWPEPRESILASGPTLDAVLVIHGARRNLAFLDGSGRLGELEHLFSGPEGTWAEASLAAGEAGFLVVRTGPGIGDLEVHLATGPGSLAAVSIPPPATSARPPDSLVRRYPRAVAIPGGWALSYWDGTGPSLVRIDTAGALTADAVELRTGDERGGHTDARMASTSGAIAVTWQVEPPMMSHGFPEEEPRRPGPRLAILRCAP